MPADYVDRARSETVKVADYDPAWPARFEEEAARLRTYLPRDLVGRIEHIGSTAVPGLAAKPIVDLQVEVPDLEVVRNRIAPILKRQGYEFFWRPTDPGAPDIAYAWFIRRDEIGRRTHHIHMIPPDSAYSDRITFRDWLRSHPEAAREYAEIKRRAARQHATDRTAYARAKGKFIRKILSQAAEAAP